MSEDKDVLSDDAWNDVPEPKPSNQPKAPHPAAAKPASDPPRPASAPPRPSSNPPKPASGAPRPVTSRPSGGGLASGSRTLIGIPAPQVEAKTSEPPGEKPVEKPSEKPAATPSEKPLAAGSNPPALRADAVPPGKRTLIGIAAPVVAPRSSEPPDPGKTPPEPFASRRPPPSNPPPAPPPETPIPSSSPPPDAEEYTGSRAKKRLASTRKETPAALAAAKQEARSHAGKHSDSEPPEKSSRLGPILVMLVVAGLAVWFVLSKQRGADEPAAEIRNPDPRAERTEPEKRPEPPALAPIPAPEPSATAAASAEIPVLEASAIPVLPASASAPPAKSAEPAEPKADETAKVEKEKAPAPVEAASADGARVVIVKLTPPDARLFYKGKSVGKSPVRIELMPGEKKRSFEVGRPGYVTRRLVIDGSEPEISIGLRPDPNAPAQ